MSDLNNEEKIKQFNTLIIEQLKLNPEWTLRQHIAKAIDLKDILELPSSIELYNLCPIHKRPLTKKSNRCIYCYRIDYGSKKYRLKCKNRVLKSKHNG